MNLFSVTITEHFRREMRPQYFIQLEFNLSPRNLLYETLENNNASDANQLSFVAPPQNKNLNVFIGDLWTKNREPFNC